MVLIHGESLDQGFSMWFLERCQFQNLRYLVKMNIESRFLQSCPFRYISDNFWYQTGVLESSLL